MMRILVGFVQYTVDVKRVTLDVKLLVLSIDSGGGDQKKEKHIKLMQTLNCTNTREMIRNLNNVIFNEK